MLLNEAHVFVRAVEQKSISAAARSLGISPAAASTRIMQLEEHLGVKLLARTTRKSAPTAAGELFYGHAIEVLDAMAVARRSVVDFLEAPKGVLRISAPLSFGRHVLAPLASQFQRLHPQIDIRLRLSDHLVDLLGADLDFVIRSGALPDSTFTMRKIADCAYVLCASPGYLATRSPLNELSELSAHSCLLQGPSGSNLSRWRLKTPQGTETVTVSGRLQADDGDVLTTWALQGEGIALKPRWEVAEQLARGDLVPVLEQFPPEPAVLSLLYPSRRMVPAKFKVFGDFLIAGARRQIEPADSRAA